MMLLEKTSPPPPLKTEYSQNFPPPLLKGGGPVQAMLRDYTIMKKARLLRTFNCDEKDVLNVDFEKNVKKRST